MKQFDRLSGVYQITCKPTGKRYIGSAHDFKKRWSLHKVHLRRGSHDSKYMQNAWNKYGQDAFEFEIMLVCSKENVLTYEQLMLDAVSPEFNTCKVAGNNYGVRYSEETKRGMSKAKRKANAKYLWKGEMRCLADIAEMENVDYSTLMARVLTLGKTIDEAVAAGESQIKKHEYKGQLKNVSQWAKEFGVHPARLNHYIKHGHSIAEAKAKMDCSEKSISFSEFCKLAGANVTTAKSRVKSGMSVMEAITAPHRYEANKLQTRAFA